MNSKELVHKSLRLVELIRVSTQVSAGDTPVLGGLRHRADGHKVTLCGAGSRWGIPVPGHQASRELD